MAADAPAFTRAWRYSFLVPIYYNEDDDVYHGQLVEDERFIKVEDALLDEIGGASLHRVRGGPVVEGKWYSKTKLVRDVSVQYDVVAISPRSSFFLGLFAALKEEFRQDDIFLTESEVMLAVSQDIALVVL